MSALDQLFPQHDPGDETDTWEPPARQTAETIRSYRVERFTRAALDAGAAQDLADAVALALEPATDHIGFPVHVSAFDRLVNNGCPVRTAVEILR